MRRFFLLIVFVFGFFQVEAAQFNVSTVAQLRSAIASAVAGDVILVSGGNYVFTTRLDIKNKVGTAANRITLKADPASSTRPKFDFSAMAESSSNQGILLDGSSYWHIKGIDVFDAGDNGMEIKNSHNNIIEFCTFSECSDTGLQIDGGSSNNLILNCDSYYNADSSIENADGFACKLDAGTGNIFRGCRAWQNLDDGWDGYLRGTDNISTTYENCWAFLNGILKNGNTSGGDGNGFKTGGSDGKDLKHNAIYTNCIAANNIKKGFDHNSNRGEVTLYNCSATGNNTNMGFGSTNQLNRLTIKNTAVLGSTGTVNAATTVLSNNSWNSNPSISVTNADFVSVDIQELKLPRKADGSLPDINFLRPKSTSALINRGVDVGLPYKGSAPDIGAFEYDPTALPLDLISFSAKVEDKQSGTVKITWVTANEANTKDFYILRKDGEGDFKIIHTENAKNTKSVNQYSFIDNNPSMGYNYYQLIQNDLDGKFTNSGTEVVYLGVQKETQVKLYPNPVVNTFQLMHPITSAGATIKILDVSGKILESFAISKNKTVSECDVSDLKLGVYFLVFSDNGVKQTVKMIKQ